MTKRKDFYYSDEREPHRARTKEILKDHPEVRHLIGKNPYTFFAILGLVSFMVVMAYVVKDSSWWIVFAAAYFLGAFANHSLFVMIHECAHNLLFKKPELNILAGILSNLPQTFPSSVSFKRYHIKHHSFQGIHELDADIPDWWEARLINNSFLGKMIWLLLYPVFQVGRTFRTKEIKQFDFWVIMNWIIQFSFDAAIIIFLGPKAFVFLLASFFFSVGLHPLGARWVQEHYLTRGLQETYSYYGVLNKVAFNVGYHNEHHDFPSVPWNKLPQIRKTAPDFYNTLTYHTSWTWLLLRFVFDKEISLFHRLLRKERGNVLLTDESKPDRELVEEKNLS